MTSSLLAIVRPCSEHIIALTGKMGYLIHDGLPYEDVIGFPRQLLKYITRTMAICRRLLIEFLFNGGWRRRTLYNELIREVYRLLRLVLRVSRWLFLPDMMIVVFLRHALTLIVLWHAMRLWKHMVWRPLQRVSMIIQGLWGGESHRQSLLEAKYRIDTATTYTEWSKASRELDRVQGLVQAWKWQPESPYYDCQRIHQHLLELRVLVDRSIHDANEIPSLIYYLRSCLLRNVAGIGHPSLYIVLRDGTKELIEDYLAEVIRAIQLVTAIDSPTVSAAYKLAFLHETRHAFGHSALMFSGGASLGMYHLGVVKCLMDNSLLPRIISGASVGAVIAAVVGTRTRKELRLLFDEDDRQHLDLNFFPPSKGALGRRLHRFLKTGVFMDIKILEKALRANVPDLTFQEAFDRTGFIINIVISPSQDNKDCARLLNYLTAPNVLVWSAALASAAIPWVYAPVELLSKDCDDNIVPYYPSTSWSDGSVQADLPLTRLAELFNVNHAIVSQTNPHVAPFLIQDTTSRGISSSVVRWVMTLFPRIVEFVRRDLQAITMNLHALGVLPKVLDPFYFIIDQRYVGDITIVPPLPYWQLGKLLTNPTVDALNTAIRVSERECWRHMARIRSQCEVEFVLDECVQRMRSIILLMHADGGAGDGVHIGRTLSWCPEQFKAYASLTESSSAATAAAAAVGVATTETQPRIINDGDDGDDDDVKYVTPKSSPPRRRKSATPFSILLADSSRFDDAVDDDLPPYRRPRGRSMSETDLRRGVYNVKEMASDSAAMQLGRWSESSAVHQADELFIQHEKLLLQSSSSPLFHIVSSPRSDN